ncbi:hypothetical protein WR25_08350 [Diploscapter pachys]|uniref:Uncharacterized protein n=1 Tax=Diploscapter pachys TaxID=2018661 RepID=A0A2A2KAZ2_9BILA|nr:hypothetical protein WR25_08350 [Diploscapter pachys]
MGVALRPIADDGDLLTFIVLPFVTPASSRGPAVVPPVEEAGPRITSGVTGGLWGTGGETYAASLPRAMATIPVRATSIRPTSPISSTNLSIFSIEPVTSNTKLVVVASTTRARYTSARRSASIR